MALSPFSRRAGVLSLTAAALIVLSQVMRLGVGRLLGPDWVTTPAYTVTYSIALLGTLLGLAALRACAFPRAAALLLLAGGLAGPLALSTPYQIPLAIAIGWIGVTLRPESRIRLIADNSRSSSRAEVRT